MPCVRRIRRLLYPKHHNHASIKPVPDLISYHPARADPAAPWRYATGFKVAPITDVTRIANGISRFAWSGILWRDGRRAEEEFLSAAWCVFDFDGGFDLQEALRAFTDCVHIIGTTKSHGLQK